MSKTININDPGSWSDDDIIHLRDRGRLPAGYDLPRHLRLASPEAPDLADIPHVGDVGTPEPAGNFVDEDGPVGTFVDDEDFDSMSKPQLQAEARARDLDDSGTKPELVERLRTAVASEQ